MCLLGQRRQRKRAPVWQKIFFLRGIDILEILEVLETLDDLDLEEAVDCNQQPQPGKKEAVDRNQQVQLKKKRPLIAINRSN